LAHDWEVNVRFRESVNLRPNIRERTALTLGEGVSGVAVGTTEITSGQSHKNAREAGEGAFTLQTEIDFIDDETAWHVVEARDFWARRTADTAWDLERLGKNWGRNRIECSAACEVEGRIGGLPAP